jgi:hypothetical protein
MEKKLLPFLDPQMPQHWKKLKGTVLISEREVHQKQRWGKMLPVAEAGGAVLHHGLGILNDERQALGLLRDVVPLQRRRAVALGTLPILRVLRRNAATVLERPAGDVHRRYFLHLAKSKKPAPNYLIFQLKN